MNIYIFLEYVHCGAVEYTYDKYNIFVEYILDLYMNSGCTKTIQFLHGPLIFTRFSLQNWLREFFVVEKVAKFARNYLSSVFSNIRPDFCSMSRLIGSILNLILKNPGVRFAQAYRSAEDKQSAKSKAFVKIKLDRVNSICAKVSKFGNPS